MHTRNLLADARVSLMLDERAEGDPLEGARIMLAGQRRARPSDDDAPLLRRRYLTAHPSAEDLCRFSPISPCFGSGPAAHIWWPASAGSSISTPEAFLTDMSDADGLLEAEQGAIEHMNADHRDAMNLYATRLLGAAEPPTGAAPAATPTGLDLQAGTTTLRLDFPQRITTPAALRQTL